MTNHFHDNGQDYYVVLGVEKNASVSTISKAYIRI